MPLRLSDRDSTLVDRNKFIFVVCFSFDLQYSPSTIRRIAPCPKDINSYLACVELKLLLVSLILIRKRFCSSPAVNKIENAAAMTVKTLHTITKLTSSNQN